MFRQTNHPTCCAPRRGWIVINCEKTDEAVQELLSFLVSPLLLPNQNYTLAMIRYNEPEYPSSVHRLLLAIPSAATAVEFGKWCEQPSSRMSIHPFRQRRLFPIIIVGKWRAILILFDKWHVPDEAKEFSRRRRRRRAFGETWPELYWRLIRVSTVLLCGWVMCGEWWPDDVLPLGCLVWLTLNRKIMGYSGDTTRRIIIVPNYVLWRYN